MSHSAREVERLKKEEADTEHPIRTEAPKIERYEWTDKTTGEVRRIPKGIDPGWDYNPGEAAWGRSESLALMEDRGPWKDFDPRMPEFYGRPKKIAVDEPKRKPTMISEKSEEALRSALRKAVGGDNAVFRDPAGGRVEATQAIVDHMLKQPTRIDGRQNYFPLIPELIEDPFEIWAGFAKSEVSGRVGVRKRYVKAVRVDKDKVLGLWAETMNGQWAAGDFFRGGYTAANNLRKGRMLYGRE
ncbi:MAG: hypothetical protein JXL84_15120 [Deltaproteobacteria bacterium]|nr:hypothetical protein [Deltaproteobacteria bacterium]